jgi:hypothetical protein
MAKANARKPAITPTAGNLWRREREAGEVVALSSMHTARLRPVALDMLITTGEIPDILTPLAEKALWGDTFRKEGSDKELIDLINIIVPMAMVSPKVVDNPQADDEIGLNDLDFLEKYTIFCYVTQPAEVLRRFRLEQEASLGSVSDSEGVGDATEHANGDTGPLGGASVR